MTDTRLPAAWLRSLAGILALAGALALGGCGGGSGAPNNAFEPFVIRNTAAGAPLDVYSGFPTALDVAGGLAPYAVTSSNPSVLPVPDTKQYSAITLLPTAVTADTVVQLTVQDSMGRLLAATVIVHPTPLANSLVIAPNSPLCGSNAICSGQTGTATVTVMGSTGRDVRFDVAAGPYAIVNPTGGASVNTLTVRSDSAGRASVLLRAFVDAPTQFAQLRVTDVASGQTLLASFLIQQVTDGTGVLSVVPGEATITSAFKGQCTSGFPIDYYIYGGTPPYRVASTFPSAVTIVNPIVLASGQAFTAITNGTCVDPLTFTIVDATGRQVTATLVNEEGDNDPPVVVPPLAASITPSTYSGCVAAQHFFPVVSGGTRPYSVSPAGTPATVPTIVVSASGGVDISNLVSPLAGSNVYNFTVRDASNPVQQRSFSITCNP
jgi:hypothetical protein